MKTHDLFIIGDIDLSLISAKRSPVATDYLFMLANYGLFPLITKPIRMTENTATLIDHIFTNSLLNSIFPGIILSDISDHFFTYCAVPMNVKSLPDKRPKHLVRDLKNFERVIYLRDLCDKIRVFKLRDIEANNFNSVFSSFVTCVKSAI